MYIHAHALGRPPSHFKFFFSLFIISQKLFFFFPFSTAPLMDAFQSRFVSDITNFFIYIDMRALQNCCLVGSVYDEPVRNDG